MTAGKGVIPSLHGLHSGDLILLTFPKSKLLLRSVHREICIHMNMIDPKTF
jgi:hypothetical protein